MLHPRDLTVIIVIAVLFGTGCFLLINDVPLYKYFFCVAGGMLATMLIVSHYDDYDRKVDEMLNKDQKVKVSDTTEAKQ